MVNFRRALIPAAFPLTLFSGQAPAEPGVVLYGNIDIAIAKESGSPARLDRGYNNWIGLRGEEDLGGGLSAIFNIQTRFNPDTGAQERPQTFWQGESTLGLKSASAGTLRLGRALSPLWQNVWAFEPWLNSGFNASLAAYQTGRYSSDGVNDAALGFANFSRIANGVFYTSPALHGLTVDVAAGVEKSAGAAGRTMGVSLNQARGPFNAMYAYERNAREDDIHFLGGSYRFDGATLMGSVAHHVLADGSRERLFVVAGTWALGPDTVRAGYGRNRDGGAEKLGVGYVHPLSKRTNLYADLHRERTAGRRNGVALGMNHTF